MTYEDLCSFDALWHAFRCTRKCKRGKTSTAEFEARAIENLLILSKSLLTGQFSPDSLRAFTIYEPKKRLIQAPTFRDKVVQHCWTDNVVYDELSRSFTSNTFAAQYGKGTHYGLDMLERHMRRHFLRKKGADEAERRASGLPFRPVEEWDYAKGFVIKGDIRHFFQSIDHERLKTALRPRIRDERTFKVMEQFIDQVEGLALGHQTSHIYAVFYVCGIMHYINEVLKLPLSGMYMDDWYVICPDKSTAQVALAAIRSELHKLGLELNNKTNIFPLEHGIDFCGFHTYLTHTGKVVRKLRRSSIKRMKTRIRLWEREYAAGRIGRNKIEQCFRSWEGHAQHGDTRELRLNMRRLLNEALNRAEKERVRRKSAKSKIERKDNSHGKVTFGNTERQSLEAQ